MTASPTPAPLKPKRRVPKIPKDLWDLFFTFVIPYLILSENLLGDGIGVASLLGGGSTGNIRAYIISCLIPVLYVAWDLGINRNLSPIALIGGAGALFKGSLAFWYVDGFWYAIKDSARPFLTSILFLISAATRTPIFKVFLEAAFLGEKPEDRVYTQRALYDSTVHKGLVQATIAYAGMDFVSGVINSIVNYHKVTAKFSTDMFNKQIKDANAIMVVPSLLLSLAGIGLAMWLVQKAVRQRYGAEASLLEPSKLAAAMRERGELGTAAQPTATQAEAEA